VLELLIYASLALGVSSLCSLVEASLLSVPGSFVTVLAAKGSTAGRRLRQMKENLSLPLAAILTLNTVAHTAGAAGVGMQSAKLFGHWSVGVAGGVMTLLILVFSEIIPKTLGAAHAKRLASVTAVAVHGMMLLTYPVIVVLERLSGALGRTRGFQPIERSELEVALALGRASKKLTDEEFHIARNALALHRVKVSQVLTPRPVVFKLQEDKTVGDVRAKHGDIPYARIPVYADDPDKPIGYVTRTDILRTAVDGKTDTPLRTLRREVHYVPETAILRDALARMLDRKEHMQLVVDEYGGFEGVVTLEDAMETLLGVEITDETDSITDLQAYARHRRRPHRAEE